MCTESAEHKTPTGTMHSVSTCALHKTNTETVHPVTICAPIQNTNTENRRAETLIKVSRRSLGMHSESRARATRVETMLAVLLCANCALAPGKTRPLSVRAQHGMHVQRGSRRLRSGHTGSQEPVDGFPSQKSGPQTRLGCFVPCYRDYP